MALAVYFLCSSGPVVSMSSIGIFLATLNVYINPNLNHFKTEIVGSKKLEKYLQSSVHLLAFDELK